MKNSKNNLFVFLAVMVVSVLTAQSAQAVAIKDEGVKEVNVKIDGVDMMNDMPDIDNLEQDIANIMDENMKKPPRDDGRTIGADQMMQEMDLNNDTGRYGKDDTVERGDKVEAKKAPDTFQDARMGEDMMPEEKFNEMFNIDLRTIKEMGMNGKLDAKEIFSNMHKDDKVLKKLTGQWISVPQEIADLPVTMKNEELHMEKMKVRDDKTIEIRSRKIGKLLGLFDFNMEVMTEMTPNGEVTKVSKPWWSFLVW